MTAERLLNALADGRTHSGEELARAFGVTRAAIWKQVGKLADWGLDVEAAPGAGYRLSRRIDLIEANALRAALAPPIGARLARLDVFTEIGSTNRHLLAAPPPVGKLDVCVAEFQTAAGIRAGNAGNSASAPASSAPGPPAEVTTKAPSAANSSGMEAGNSSFTGMRRYPGLSSRWTVARSARSCAGSKAGPGLR